ncbi:MAG: OmpA family protein [Elusimicrobiota bacterium]
MRSERINKLFEHSEEEDTTELWMAPYGNLMVLLVVLFLSLYGFSRLNSTKYEKSFASNAKDEKIAKFAEQMEKQKMKVELNAQKLRIQLPSPVLFDPGKADLKKEALSSLSEMVGLLKELDSPVIVEGHTDNVPLGTGARYGSNWELSASRAFSVIKYFIDQGLSPERFSAYGYGEFLPLMSNDTDDNRAMNRRIEIIILRQAAENKVKPDGLEKKT